jgi:hypothetical protein
LADQFSHRIAGPQKPRQAELIGRGLADQCHKLLLLGFGQGGLLTRTAAAAPLRKPRPTALPVAFDPAVHGVVVDAEHPRRLSLGHALQHRSNGPAAQRCLRRGRQ